MAQVHGRNSKKLRSRQRERIDETLTAIVRAEEAAKEGKGKAALVEDDWEHIQLQGLVNPNSFDLFLTWYAFGGTERGISLTELIALPADIIKDFQYILGQLSQIRSAETYGKPS